MVRKCEYTLGGTNQLYPNLGKRNHCKYLTGWLVRYLSNLQVGWVSECLVG